MNLLLNDLKAIALNSYAHGIQDPFLPFALWESWYDYRYSQGFYPDTDWENVETVDRISLYASDRDWKALTQHPLGKALYWLASPYYRLLFWLNTSGIARRWWLFTRPLTLKWERMTDAN